MLPSQDDIFNNYFPKKQPMSEIVISKPTEQNVNEGQNIPQKNDVEDFTDKLKSLLDNSWEDGWGEFTMESPTDNNPDSAELPRITFDVTHRVPSKAKKGLKSRIIEYIADPSDDTYAFVVCRKWFDAIFEFLMFHNTNKESRDLMNRLESLMEVYTGYFKENGLSEIIFEEETDPRLSKKYKEGIPCTCIRYKVVLERVLVERVRTTKEIRAKLTSHNPSL